MKHGTVVLFCVELCCVALQDGTLQAVGSLDRERQETYELLVKASDDGRPQREVRLMMEPSC